MSSKELDDKMREVAAQHVRLMENLGQRLLAAVPTVTGPPIAMPHFRLSDQYGWELPNGIMLFIWGSEPGRPVGGGFELLSSLRGFVGRPEGYDDEIGRAVARGLFNGLPVMWESAFGAGLLLRWAGPTRAETQFWFVFSGTAEEFNELFRRARRF